MENMLLKLEKDELKKKGLKYLNENTFQKTKNSINTNIIKNLNNIKNNNNANNNINSKKKNNQKNSSNIGLYSLVKTEFNNGRNKNNIFPINNNNYNFITGSRLDLNRYYSRNKTNISYNTIGKNVFRSQENLNLKKNKNSFSLKDFRRMKNGINNKNKSKKSSSKKNTKYFNYINDENYIIDNYKSKKGTNYENNKFQIITEPCLKGNYKNKEKIIFIA